MKKILALILSVVVLFSVVSCTSDYEPITSVVGGDRPVPTEEIEPNPEIIDEPEPVDTGTDESVPYVPPADITPLMWLVTAPDGQTMHLFGSIHAGDLSIYPLPGTIMDAFTSADYLAVEVDIVAFAEDMAAMMAFNMELMYQDGRTVADEIGEELTVKALDLIRELKINVGGPVELMRLFKPFMLIQVFTIPVLEGAGLEAELGLDMFFLEEAKKRGIEILEVESIESQLAAFNSFSPELNIALIESALDIEAGVEGLIELYEAWKIGDEQFIEAMKTEEDMDSELDAEYMDILLTQRDIVMADAVEQYFAEGKNVFYVVGLMHLVGEDSVVDLLRQRGYDVEVVEVS